MAYTDPWGKWTMPTAKSNAKRRPRTLLRAQTARPQKTHLTTQIANTTKMTTSAARNATNEDENPAAPEAATEKTQATAIEAATETRTAINPQTMPDAETVLAPQFKTVAGTATTPHKRITTATIATVDTGVTAVHHATTTAIHAAQTAGRDAGIHIALDAARALLGPTMNGADLQGPPTTPRDHTMTVTANRLADIARTAEVFVKGFKTHVPFTNLTDAHCQLEHIVMAQEERTICIGASGTAITSALDLPSSNPEEMRLPLVKWLQAYRRFLALIAEYQPHNLLAWNEHHTIVFAHPLRDSHWALVLRYDIEMHKRSCYGPIDVTMFQRHVFEDI
ncbi:hypothetical protein FRC10_003302 [Ceratobasidium sp. 414]|nr:hypothetical protein FRC10_003302 [Ceratobasidium sp. 414]